jgi:hypothetical protein
MSARFLRQRLLLFVEMIGVEKDGIVEVDSRVPGFLLPLGRKSGFGENGNESSSARPPGRQSAATLSWRLPVGARQRETAEK